MLNTRILPSFYVNFEGLEDTEEDFMHYSSPYLYEGHKLHLNQIVN